MKIVFNFLPIVTGGGLQNALSLLEAISRNNEVRKNIVCLVRGSGELYSSCKNYGLTFIKTSPNNAGRFKFELTCRVFLKKNQPVFTLFGPTLLASKGWTNNINGFAYSNLLYPEINFWEYLYGISRARKLLIDKYRMIGAMCSDYLIFETDVLRERAVKILRVPNNRTGVVPMTPSSLVSVNRIDNEIKDKFNKLIPNKFRVLFLCGAHPNKQLHLLPKIARALKIINAENVVLVTTFDNKTKYAQDIELEFKKQKISDMYINLGPVKPVNVASLVNVVDAMCNISVLESFSNNFVEAWQMKVPLLVTDSDWAKSACGEAAIYVNPSNCFDVAQKIKRLSVNAEFREKMVKMGEIRLDLCPSHNEKLELYMQHIDNAIRLGRRTKR